MTQATTNRITRQSSDNMSFDTESFVPAPPAFRFQAWSVCREMGWESLQENRQLARFIEENVSAKFKALFRVSPVMPTNNAPALAIPRTVRITLTHSCCGDWEKDVKKLAKVELPAVARKYFKVKLNIKLDFYNAFAEGEEFENRELARALISESLPQRLRGFLLKVKDVAGDDLPHALHQGKTRADKILHRTRLSSTDEAERMHRRLSFSSFASTSFSPNLSQRTKSRFSSFGSPVSFKSMRKSPTMSGATQELELAKETAVEPIRLRTPVTPTPARPRTSPGIVFKDPVIKDPAAREPLFRDPVVTDPVVRDDVVIPARSSSVTAPPPVKEGVLVPTRANTVSTPILKDAVSNLARGLASGSFMTNICIPSSPFALLFFQLPDNIMQFSILSRYKNNEGNYSLSVFGTSPIARATRRSPVQALMKKNAIYIYFQKTASRSGQAPVLAEAKMTLANENISWNNTNLQFPEPVKLHPRAEHFSTNVLLLEAESNPGGLVAATADRENGEWLMTRPPESMPFDTNAHYFTTTCFEPDSLRVRGMARENIVQCQIDHFRTWKSLKHADLEDSESAAIQKKDLDWHGKPPSHLPSSCRLVEGDGTGVIGVLSRSDDFGVYYFHGHPWWDELKEPELVCKLKRGTNFLYIKEWRDIVYLSPQNQVKRVHIGLEPGDIVSVGTPAAIKNGDPLAMMLNSSLNRDDY